jgi:tetratricopeptide (TPR) repeat protein
MVARGAIAAAMLASALIAPLGHAQPAQPAPPNEQAALDRAKDLYKSAEQAMTEDRFDDAIRDYGAAFELSKDPALFFKIGRANERAGRCEVAVVYYERYLREGKPDDKFVATTRERIAACGGESRSPDAGAASEAPPPAPAPPPPISPEPAAPKPAAAIPVPSNPRKIAWVIGGTGIALATLGGVLAYAADSSENDIRDLYTGFAGRPPTFDDRNQKTYRDLVDKGRRYEHLSWASFGLAGAAAVGAAVLFVVGGSSEHGARVAPVVTGRGAGVALAF